MIPKPEDYKILKMFSRYFVLDPYDLFTMPALALPYRNFETYKEAQDEASLKFERDYSEYERLKARGRDFPDND